MSAQMYLPLPFLVKSLDWEIIHRVRFLAGGNFVWPFQHHQNYCMVCRIKPIPNHLYLIHISIITITNTIICILIKESFNLLKPCSCGEGIPNDAVLFYMEIHMKSIDTVDKLTCSTKHCKI